MYASTIGALEFEAHNWSLRVGRGRPSRRHGKPTVRSGGDRKHLISNTIRHRFSIDASASEEETGEMFEPPDLGGREGNADLGAVGRGPPGLADHAIARGKQFSVQTNRVLVGIF